MACTCHLSLSAGIILQLSFIFRLHASRHSCKMLCGLSAKPSSKTKILHRKTRRNSTRKRWKTQLPSHMPEKRSPKHMARKTLNKQIASFKESL